MSDFIRYAKNIRKIAEQARNLNKALADADAKSRILGERRIGYLNGNGSTAVSGSGSPGSTRPILFGNLTGFATDQQIQNVTNTVNNEYRTINNALLAGIGTKITGLTGLKDCTTGKGVTITGQPEFKPPANWDNASTPSATNPIRWDLGFRYTAATTPPTYGETAEECAMNVPANLSGATWTFVSYIDPASIGSTAEFAARYTGEPGGLTANLGIEKVSCIAGSDPFCPSARAPTPWPADGQMQLARGADGKFRYSENEAGADVIPEYTDNQHSKLDLCFDDGSGRKAGIQPMYDGGYMLYERDPTTGEPIGRVQFIDQNGVVTGHGLPEDIDSYLPTGLS